MKTAEELFGTTKENTYYYRVYQTIIDNIGEALVQVDDDDYQGDTRVLLKKDNVFGLLIFGWGSCSGCDALEACESIEDLQKLMDDLYNSVKWFDSLDEAKDYILDSVNTETKFYYHSKEWREFVEKVRIYS